MIDFNVGERHSLAIHAEGQYQLISSNDDDAWPAPDGLTTGGDGWVAVLTGTRYGTITLDIAFHEVQPTDILEDFEMVAERDLEVDNRTIEIHEPLRSKVDQLRLANGVYRIRISVRNRQEANQTHNDGSPLEQHLLEIWPVTERSDPVTLRGPDIYGRNYYQRRRGKTTGAV